jgi:hypothetical protein
VPVETCGVQPQHPGLRGPAGRPEVLVQAGEGNPAADLGIRHPGTDPLLAGEHALLDEVVQGAAHRRPGDVQRRGELDLIGQPLARQQFAAVDRFFQALAHLKVERNRT